jgi:hypothetical protein
MVAAIDEDAWVHCDENLQIFKDAADLKLVNNYSKIYKLIYFHLPVSE